MVLKETSAGAGAWRRTDLRREYSETDTICIRCIFKKALHASIALALVENLKREPLISR
jgi:hypothetical protein